MHTPAQRRSPRRKTPAAVAALALVALGCTAVSQLLEAPGKGKLAPPAVSVAAVKLEEAPSGTEIAALLCPKVAPAFVCRFLTGGKSPRFVFSLELDVKNEHALPLPVVSALVAFTAFPGREGQKNLGATCLSLCEDPAKCTPAADACAADPKQPDLRSMKDFAGAAAGFLFAAATGREKLENLRVRTVRAKETTRVKVALEVDVPTLVGLASTLAKDAIDAVKGGRVPTLELPYVVEGTLFLTVEGLGRVAVAVPKHEGTFRIGGSQPRAAR